MKYILIAIAVIALLFSSYEIITSSIELRKLKNTLENDLGKNYTGSKEAHAALVLEHNELKSVQFQRRRVGTLLIITLFLLACEVRDRYYSPLPKAE